MLDALALVTPAAVGAPGAATSNVLSARLTGLLTAIYIDYTNVVAATPTVVVASDSSLPSFTYLTRTTTKTGNLFPVRKTVVDNTGAALTYDGSHGVPEMYPITDQIRLTLTLANALDYVSVWIYYLTKASW